ncbi:MAG: alanine racemase [Gammaproteobacteria bacterium]|nr:alanine racemase [Gammaproteobacteria bacterium]MDH4316070.1 alanine racemase [Gammaproteobacteria bacterium]MDH5215099.1 alanine racemase [Gammaproteobacteria bacterium]
MSFGARIRIRLGALQHNFTILRNAAGAAKICAVVKANAFGHGLLTITRNLPDVDSFAVARLSEARTLRDDGNKKPIVLLAGVLTNDDLRQALHLDCEIVVHNLSQLEALEAFGPAAATVWLKVDTGMHRLGVFPEDVESCVERLRACPAVKSTRLMSHLANADDPDDPMTSTQLRRFDEIAGKFSGDISIANSAAILAPGRHAAVKARAGSNVWVRPGIALYGVSPLKGHCGADLGLQPVMEFESHLVAVKLVRKGEPVGYGGTWTAGQDTAIGIVSAGYGDGYSRFLPSGTPVLVNGRRVPLAGTVSMDMLAVDLGPASRDKAGDNVLLWGGDLPVEEVAANAGTIAYQLICGVTHREPAVVVPA